MNIAPSKPGQLRTASLVGVLVSVFVVPMSVAGSAMTLPSIAASLDGDATALQWVVNAFNVMFAVTTIGWGWLADRISHQRVLRIGAIVVMAGSALSATATNIVMLDIVRGIVGTGSAALLTSSTGLIATRLDPRRRVSAFAIFGVVMGLGLALGPTFAGLVVDLSGWRAAFGWVGAVVLAGLLIGGKLPRGSERTASGGRNQFRSVLFNLRFLAVCMIPVLHAVGFIATLTYLPLVLRAAWGLTGSGAGIAMLMMTVPALAASPLGPLLMRWPRWTFGRVIALALACLLGGNICLLTVGIDAPVALIVGMFLVGFAFGLPLGLLDAAALGAAPVEASGTAAGLFNLVRLGAEALAVAAIGAALSSVLSFEGSEDAARAAIAGETGTESALLQAFVLVQSGVVVLVCLGAAAALVLLHRNRQPTAGRHNERAGSELMSPSP